MSLSPDLISQFVAVVAEPSDKKSDTTVYGTIVEYEGTKHVRLDGAEEGRVIPYTSTTSVNYGDRVVVMIKNHQAVITGNMDDPASTTGELESATNVFVESSEHMSGLIAEKVDTEELDAAKADIEKLLAKDVEIENRLEANEADISHLETEKLDAESADLRYAQIGDLEAAEADIDDLYTKKLDAEAADIKYANIDFSNITKVAMEYFYATSGLVENVVVGDGTITGKLVGVTISGDIIEGNTIVAEKLVIKGEDGLYYKLNTDGITTEAEQTEYNSLNGNVILAKSITATKIAVDDLVAFDATIGGFNITENSIYSEVKDSEDNVTRGIYMDTDGQFNFGDSSNFVKYYRDDDGTYKLVISATSILYALNGKQYSISDLGRIGEYVHIGTYENEPCIELGENDSDFRLIITNTRILFMEGTSVPAYINNKSLHITKAVIEEELQQGQFVWKVRQNGNIGLMWKGAEG